MNRKLTPIIAALILVIGSMIVFSLTSTAATAQESTAVAQATATRTPRITREATTEATEEATVESTAEATEEADDATPEATEEAATDDEATATDEAASEEPAAEIITGSVLPEFQIGEDQNQNRTLTVIGTGTVRTAPGAATITLGVETADADVTEAAGENEDIIQEIIAAIDELGIPKENLQTANLSVYLDTGERGLESGGSVTYRVSQQVMVTIADLQETPDLLGDVVEAAVEAGANSVYGPSFQIVETREMQQQARKRAMEDALARAQDYATLAGVELTGVVSIVEGGSMAQPYDMVRLEAADSAAGGGIGSSIESGMLSYQSSVQVVFYITDAAPATDEAATTEGEGEAATEGEAEVEATAEAEGEGEATPEGEPEATATPEG